MRLVNTTNILDEEIREYFDFCAKSLDVNNLRVVCEGKAQVHGGFWGYSMRNRKEIHIAIPNEKKDKRSYPFFNWKRPKYFTIENYVFNEQSKRWEPRPGVREVYNKLGRLPCLILSRQEYIIHVMAHESRHQWQKKRRPKSEWTFGTNNSKRTWGGDEADADAYAIRKQREWRRLHQVDIYREQPDTIPLTQVRMESL